MFKTKLKWSSFVSLYLIFNSVFVICIPISKDPYYVLTEETPYISGTDSIIKDNIKISEPSIEKEKSFKKFNVTNNNINNSTKTHEDVISTLRSDIRPGQVATTYNIEITIDDWSFNGRAIIRVQINTNTRGEPIRFNCEDLNINSVQFGQNTLVNPQNAEYDVDGGVLEIRPPLESQTFIFLIEYSGSIRSDGFGLYRASYEDSSYLAMNLHPTHARRVFPCMDEPTEAAPIEIHFNNAGHENIISNSINDGDQDEAEFRMLESASHQWGLIAHDFANINIPGDRLRFLGRVTNQGNYASIMTQSLFNFLNEFTEKPYHEIHDNQEGNMNIIAMPDITRDWYALSTVAIWEPYIFMVDNHSVKQQISALTTMAEAYARQWFGYVIYPENWRFAWITTGLSKYAAYEAAAESDDPLDMDSLFLTEIIQESMLMDSYSIARVLEPGSDIFGEQDIRNHYNDILKYKAPAMLKWLKLVLGQGDDYIHHAAKFLVNSRSLQAVNNFHFYDAINNGWLTNDDGVIDNVIDWFQPWISNTGYPVIHVELRPAGGLFITQERFGFGTPSGMTFDIPLSYTTRNEPDFDDIYPHMVMGETSIIGVSLGDDDWVIFNVQGQGYYRVSYQPDLWDRLIDAMDEEETRNDIHHLNRASILDDALNLARGGRTNYDVGLRLAMTMGLEQDYAPWKTYVRNMNFIYKRMAAMAEEQELDTDMYLRLLRHAITSVEQDIGFFPETNSNEPTMNTRVRGLVMEHACKAHYQPCLAAAANWFFDRNSEDFSVNPDIPPDIRPAVYCSMVREGDIEVVDALWRKFEEEPSHYERIVILESIACSRDEGLIFSLLEATINGDSRFGMEERTIFFEAVANSHLDNANVALRFLRANTNSVRNSYGGTDRLDRVIYALGDNLLTDDLLDTFDTWLNAMNSNLDDSFNAAERALEKARQDRQWNDEYFQQVYDWIEENDAPTLTVSVILVVATMLISIFNS